MSCRVRCWPAAAPCPGSHWPRACLPATTRSWWQLAPLQALCWSGRLRGRASTPGSCAVRGTRWACSCHQDLPACEGLVLAGLMPCHAVHLWTWVTHLHLCASTVTGALLLACLERCVETCSQHLKVAHTQLNVKSAPEGLCCRLQSRCVETCSQHMQMAHSQLIVNSLAGDTLQLVLNSALGPFVAGCR